jgi:hypothetical protein
MQPDPSLSHDQPFHQASADRLHRGVQPTFYSLHLLTALLMFGIDEMAGALEIASFGVFCVVSLLLAALAFVPCVLIQRYVAHDSWGASVAKAMVVSILTGIPTGLPGWLTLAWGVVSAVRSRPAADPYTLN